MKKIIFLLLVMAINELKAFDSGELPSNFYMKILNNGLEVLVIEDNTVPLATIEICVKNGSYTETPDYNGLSHLYEHMFFKANKDYPSQEKFLERVNELGIVFNGTTSNERVNYYVTLNNSKLNEGLQFINSAIRYPLFDKVEMKKENVVVDGEFQRNESNPAFFLFDELNRHLWKDHYCRKNVIGDHTIINTATPEKMEKVQQKFYYPNNSILVVAGDVAHDDVFAKAEMIYGDWQASTFDVFQKYPVPEFDKLATNEPFVVINDNARVPFITIGWHGPDTRNDLKATYAADVFSYILGQQSSKLQKELVDEGLAYNVSLSYQTCKHTGPIQFFVVANPSKIKECIAKVKEHIALWETDTYYTDEELSTAKQILAVDDNYSKEKTSDFIHLITFWWCSATIDYYTNYVKNLNDVTRTDINNYINKYIKNKPAAWGILVNSQTQSTQNIDESIFGF
jgi:zinc protease